MFQEEKYWSHCVLLETHCLYIDITLFTDAQSRDIFFAEE